MAKKKNKKKMYDFDGSYQEKMMQEIDELLYGSGSVEDDSDDIVSALSKSLNCESKDYAPTMQNHDGSAKYAYMQISDKQEGKARVSSVYGEVGHKPDFMQNIDNANSIRIFFYEETKIMTIKDSVREISIDLNLLNNDDSNEIDEDDIVDLFGMTLLSSISNLYPSAIISNSKLNNVFKNISSINEGKFLFFNCPYKTGMSLVYNIPDESWSDFHDVIQASVDMDCSIALINAIRNLLDADGISFRKVTPESIDLIIANPDNNKSGNAIIGLINSDEDTIKDNVNNPSFTSVIELNSFIPPVDEDDEDDDVDDESDESADEYDEEPSSEETDEPEVDGVSVEIEDSEEVVFDSKSDDKSSEPPVVEESPDERVEVPPIDDEDDGEIDLGEDDEVEENGNDDSGEIDLTENDKPIDPEEMDHEDAEKYYFGNKPAPRESMKSSNSNKSHDSFLVKKRKRNS